MEGKRHKPPERMSGNDGLLEVQVIQEGTHIVHSMLMAVERLIVRAIALAMPAHVPWDESVRLLQSLDLPAPHARRSPKAMR
jgi:hypothetical protein